MNQGRNNLNTYAPPYQATPPDHVQQVGMVSAPIRKTFSFDLKWDVEGQPVDGSFTCRKLTLREIGQLGVRKSQLNGGYYFDSKNPGVGIDEDTDWINQMISHLEISLVQAPWWFNLNNLDDADLLAEVYRRVATFENSFFEDRRKRTAHVRSSQNDSSRASQESRSVGHVAQVDREQVQTSLDP